MANKLEKEFKYYLKHQDEFAKKYKGQYIVIKDESILGVYEDELKAIEEVSKEHKLGTFLVQKCEFGSQNYSQTYHSRVAFG